MPDTVLEQTFTLLCEAHDAENGQSVAALSADFSNQSEELLTVSCLVNAAVRKHSEWPPIFPLRVLMSTLPFTPNVRGVSFDYFFFEPSFDVIICKMLHDCNFITSMSFLFCTGLTNDLWLPIANCIVMHPSVCVVAITQSRFKSELERLGEAGIKKFVSRKVGASTEVVKRHDRPLSELVAQSAEASTPEPSLGAFSARGEVSESDNAWAEQVFRNFRIPLEALFDFEGRRSLKRFIDTLRSGSQEAKVQANEILQARHFLLKDPTLEARIASSRRTNKRVRIEVSCEESADDYSSALEVLRDNGLSANSIQIDPLLIDTKLTFLRKKGREDAARQLERAAACVRRSRFAATVAAEPAAPSLWSENIASSGIDAKQWAHDKLQEYGLVAADVTTNSPRWLNILDSLRNNKAAAEEMERAGRAFTQARPPSIGRTVITNDELKAWATKVLCQAFQINDVRSLDHLSSEEVEDTLEMMEQETVADTRSALRIRKQIALGQGPADMDVLQYRRRNNLI